jgi:hypothetical protein
MNRLRLGCGCEEGGNLSSWINDAYRKLAESGMRIVEGVSGA